MGVGWGWMNGVGWDGMGLLHGEIRTFERLNGTHTVPRGMFSLATGPYLLEKWARTLAFICPICRQSSDLHCCAPSESPT